MTSFLPLLLLTLTSTAFAYDVSVPLQRVDLFERLGLNNASTATGSLDDGRLDAIFALGGDMYTAQLGVGTPQQPMDFLLNFLGDVISPGIGDLSLVVGKIHSDNETMFNGLNETVTFNSSASSTFKPRPDIHFNTLIHPYPWSFNASGSIAEENIQVPYAKVGLPTSKRIILRERMFGQVEHIDGQVFGKLQIGGMLSIGKQSRVAQTVEKFSLFLGKEKSELRLHNVYPSDLPCNHMFNQFNLLDTIENQTDSLVTSLDGYKLKIKGVGMKIPPYMAYDDNEGRIAVVNPNSMFLQGPQKTVQIWAKMVNAKQLSIGEQDLYVINCNEPFGPLTFKIGTGSEEYRYPLLKEDLQFALPSNLLHQNHCIWAIQEGKEGQDFWVIGRPFFKKYCLSVNLQENKIGFPSIL